MAHALVTSERTSDPGPHRAMAEAVRLRLDELYQHGCFRRLDDGTLRAEIVRAAEPSAALDESLSVHQAGDLGLLVLYGTGFEGWLAHYRWSRGKVRAITIVTGEAGGMEQQLLVLDAELFQPQGAPQPLVALASSHPWHSSCWRNLRFRVLAPTGDPVHPRVILDRSLGGRVCEGVDVVVESTAVSFRYDAWGGPWSVALVQRPYVASYGYAAGALARRFGFAPKIELLAEDWLLEPWSLAKQATVPNAVDRLEPVHESLHAALRDWKSATSAPDEPVYTSELFPVSQSRRRLVLYCARAESNRPCPRWPKPVDVLLERSEGLWRVADVRPRP